MCKPYYTCTGSVRGNCGHKHRTIDGAVRCLERDASGCSRQGGYSDRELVPHNGAQPYYIEEDPDGHLCAVMGSPEDD